MPYPAPPKALERARELMHVVQLHWQQGRWGDALEKARTGLEVLAGYDDLQSSVLIFSFDEWVKRTEAMRDLHLHRKPEEIKLMPEERTDQTKFCDPEKGGCGRDLPLDAFQRSARNPEIRWDVCKKCFSKKCRGARTRKATQEPEVQAAVNGLPGAAPRAKPETVQAILDAIAETPTAQECLMAASCAVANGDYANALRSAGVGLAGLWESIDKAHPGHAALLDIWEVSFERVTESVKHPMGRE